MSDDSEKLNYQPADRRSKEVEAEIGSLSSELLDMLRVKGKATPADPMAGPCGAIADAPESYRSVRHPWSLYGVDNKVLGVAMENLAEALPKHGWQVVKRGPAANKNRSLEILAVHLESKSQAEISWMKGQDGHEPLISFAVYSRCFSDPDASASPSSGD
ncbi:hypothetical protein [Streptomyces zagrosensis]|uniref:Uncharacterized protein n=1 Tax=Streptomyces zagrosensis TaxID=1042984 RepID=A0A7W9UZH2_9ACTN|nr:hypothetical protein [Streptomyces zagrosensis]MBB5936737.1 hypothetical protein [Streptomyces zagrosensis]